MRRDAVKLDFTIQGKEAWVYPFFSPPFGDFVRVGDCLLASTNSESAYEVLGTDGTWLDGGGPPARDIKYAPQEELIAFAQQFSDPQASSLTPQVSYGYGPGGLKLPFQIEGLDVWINGDRMSFGNQHAGISGPFYLADGPEGTQPDRRGFDIKSLWSAWHDTSGWSTLFTGQEAMNAACKIAGVPSLDINTIPRTGGSMPVNSATVTSASNFERLLGATLYSLTKLPTPHPQVRGLILQKLKVFPFPEISDEDFTKEPRDIEGWLVANYKPLVSSRPITKAPSPVNPDARERRYKVTGSYSRSVTGTAKYSATENFSGSTSFTADELRELYHEHDGDREAILDAIESAVDDDSSDWDGAGAEDYEYSDEEQDDSDHNGDLEVDNSETILDRFLADHPELENPPEEEEEEEDAQVAEIPSEAPGMRGFEPGQRVKVAGGYRQTLDNEEGVIVEIAAGSILVRFDRSIEGLHNGQNRIPEDHNRCFWIEPFNLQVAASA